MKRTLLSAVIWCTFNWCFAQQKTLIDSINKIVGPRFLVDTTESKSYSYHSSLKEVDLNGDGIKEIVTVAGDSASGDNEVDKIFIFARKQGLLTMIDSSMAFELDGRGPHVEVKGKQLLIEHSFHHGSSSLTYTFSPLKNKYQLTALAYNTYTPNAPDMRHGMFVNEKYNINTGKLNRHTRIIDQESDGDYKEKNKVIIKKKPASLSLLLREMKDPFEYYDVFDN